MEVDAAEAEAESYPSWTMLLLARMMSNHSHALHAIPLRSLLHADARVANQQPGPRPDSVANQQPAPRPDDVANE